MLFESLCKLYAAFAAATMLEEIKARIVRCQSGHELSEEQVKELFHNFVLLYASRSSNYVLAERALKRGADPTYKFDYGKYTNWINLEYNAVFSAVLKKDSAMVRLLSKNVDLLGKNRYSEPMNLCLSRALFRLVHDATMNLKVGCRVTELHMCDVLIKCGAEVDFPFRLCSFRNFTARRLVNEFPDETFDDFRALFANCKSSLSDAELYNTCEIETD